MWLSVAAQTWTSLATQDTYINMALSGSMAHISTQLQSEPQTSGFIAAWAAA